ncbi:MAG: NAD(P)-dependent oxidoreductase [bacterium]
MATKPKPGIRVAVLGLGRMGGLMAKHLAAAGHAVSGYDPAKKALAAARRNGVRTAASVREAVRGAEVVCTSLPSPAAVREVYLGAGGGLAAMRRGAVCFELSTSEVPLALEIAAAAKKRGIAFLDAPVSGSVPHLARKEVAAMVGGDKRALQKRRAVLDAFCKSVTYMGPVGNGLIMKLVTNHVLNIHLVGLAEGLAFGMKGGLPAADMVEFLKGSAVPNLLFYKGTEMAARDYTEVISDVGVSLKDLGLSIDEANGRGASVPLGAAARQQYVSAMALGHLKSDFNAVFEAYLNAMGEEPKKPRGR